MATRGQAVAQVGMHYNAHDIFLLELFKIDTDPTQLFLLYLVQRPDFQMAVPSTDQVLTGQVKPDLVEASVFLDRNDLLHHAFACDEAPNKDALVVVVANRY